MNTFSLRITSCDRVFYEGECEIITFPGYDGRMAIMANHEQMTTTIEVGEVMFRTPDGKEHIAIVSDGILKVNHNRVEVLVYSAEAPEEIDAFRAQEEQLKQKQSIMEYHISTASMARAMARLSGKNRLMNRK